MSATYSTGVGAGATGALPIGLAHNVSLVNDVPKGQVVTWSDVRVDEASDAVKIRRKMESRSAALS